MKAQVFQTDHVRSKWFYWDKYGRWKEVHTGKVLAVLGTKLDYLNDSASFVHAGIVFDIQTMEFTMVNHDGGISSFPKNY